MHYKERIIISLYNKLGFEDSFSDTTVIVIKIEL